MLILRLEHSVSRFNRIIGPAPYFRIAGNVLQAGPDNTELGAYHQGLWDFGGEAYLTVTAEEPITLRFEGTNGSSGTHGPFPQLRVVDGAIRHGPNFNDLLARLDEGSRTWFFYTEQKSCPTVILAPS